MLQLNIAAMANSIIDEFYFKPLEESDLILLSHWLDKPHVKRWWPHSLTTSELQAKYRNRIGDNIVVPFIIYMQETPIGFIQYYLADKVGDGWWPDATAGTVGIDQFIGEEALLNQGHGTKMINEFIQQVLKPLAIEKIITDVDPTNLRAIRCYEKVGFKFASEVITPDGPAYLMILNLN
jgi:RimJ/RimL family protein N-acetyltransferase